jgi:hypothetical protein
MPLVLATSGRAVFCLSIPVWGDALQNVQGLEVDLPKVLEWISIAREVLLNGADG